jgi:hypothetical protein
MLHSALADIKADISPELRLWAAVLLKARNDARGVNNPRPHVMRSAITYLTSGDADWICDQMNLNPAKLKNVLLMGLP